uniref:NAC-A/B domain-containing protein n=1 Tax=Nothobranchius furzeri TaxID=105023 RepID=A0A8C6M5F1_NOTFU
WFPSCLQNEKLSCALGFQGLPRRKKKVVYRTATAEDKKLTKEVNVIKDDGTAIHYNNPKVQASTKRLTEIISSLRKLAEHFPRQGGIKTSPVTTFCFGCVDLVENFDEASRNEAD